MNCYSDVAVGRESGVRTVSAGMRFAVLGPVRAWRDGQELRLGPPQQRALLAVLLLRENVQVPMPELIRALWTGDEVPVSAEQIVRTYVSRLRKVFRTAPGDSVASTVIASVSQGYLLQAGPGALDLARFRDRAAAAKEATRRGEHARAAALLDGALRLWGGSSLAGVPGEFAAVQRRYLDALRLSGFEAKAASLVEAGAYGEAEALLEAMTDRHPLNERFRELRMLTFYRHGRQSDALAVYRETRKLLADELGVDPGPALRTLHDRILRNDPALLPDRPVAETHEVEAALSIEDDIVHRPEAHGNGGPDSQDPWVIRPAQLPADLGSFVGRDRELAAANALLTGAVRRSLVVLAGMAGVGKTAFAVHWAHRIAHCFPDGQIHLNLRGFDPARPPLTAYEALGVLFDSLGVPGQQVSSDLDQRSAYWRSLVADKRLLLVLDNARDADQVRPLLPGGGRSLVVVTSRNHLRGLTVHEDAGVVELDLLPSADAVRLLARRSGLTQPDDQAELHEIAEQCGRLPLAMAVIAARLASAPHQPLAAILARLRDRHDVLDTFLDVDAGVDLRSVFSLSVRALSAPAAELFSLLSLPQVLPADEAVAASLSGRPVASVRRLLAELTAANLLISRTPGRYTYHVLVSLYGAELAAELTPDERHAAVRRLQVHSARSADNSNLATRRRQQLSGTACGTDHPAPTLADAARARAG